MIIASLYDNVKRLMSVPSITATVVPLTTQANTALLRKQRGKLSDTYSLEAHCILST